MVRHETVLNKLRFSGASTNSREANHCCLAVILIAIISTFWCSIVLENTARSGLFNWLCSGLICHSGFDQTVKHLFTWAAWAWMSSDITTFLDWVLGLEKKTALDKQNGINARKLRLHAGCFTCSFIRNSKPVSLSHLNLNILSRQTLIWSTGKISAVVQLRKYVC